MTAKTPFVSAQEALSRLREGNRRFASGSSSITVPADGLQPVAQSLMIELREFADEKIAESLYVKYHAEKKTYPSCPLLFVPHDTTYALNKYLQEAQISKRTSKGIVDFHAFRVSYINLILGSGATAKTAQTLARHASVDMTLNVYGRTDNDNLRTSIEGITSTILAQHKKAPDTNTCVSGASKVLGAGVEPALVAQHAPQACASANSATRAAMAQKLVWLQCKSNCFLVKK